tara:strand:+ start:1612 stop:2244 length:633 start_codon:yes stop_codon:yes gene_type:complete
MRVNYFDLGFSWDCTEIDKIINDIFPSLDIKDYKVYAFDACKEYAIEAHEKYSDNSKVEIFNYAVSDRDEEIKLYHHWNRVGHSIYSTKEGISNKYEKVWSIAFSKWIKETVPNFEESYNIMKINIEGAEWPVFKNMEENNIIKYFNLFCGSGHDIEKVTELSGVVDEYWNLIKRNNIKIHRFSPGWKPEQDVDMKKLVGEDYENFILSK